MLYDLLNLRALKFSPLNNMYIYIYILDAQVRYLAHMLNSITDTLKDMIISQLWSIGSSVIYEPISILEMNPLPIKAYLLRTDWGTGQSGVFHIRSISKLITSCIVLLVSVCVNGFFFCSGAGMPVAGKQGLLHGVTTQNTTRIGEFTVRFLFTSWKGLSQ